MIAQAEEKIIELAQEYKLTEAISLAVESVEMIKEEGIWSMLTDECAFAHSFALALKEMIDTRYLFEDKVCHLSVVLRQLWVQQLTGRQLTLSDTVAGH